jgi:hypothetical protein
LLTKPAVKPTITEEDTKDSKDKNKDKK